MNLDAQSIDGDAPIALCPFEVVSDIVDVFVESARVFAEGLSESALIPEPLGRSFSSAVEANGALFKQVTRTRPASSRYFWGRGAAAGARQSPRTVSLSAKAGAEASGAFSLQNQRSETIQAIVLPTAFVDAAGDHAAVDLHIEPGRVMLDPGQEVVVRVSATVPAGLAPGQQLRGAIHVPDLTTSTVPVVIQSQ